MLHATVVPGAEQPALAVEERGADRDAALREGDAGLLRSDRELVRVGRVDRLRHAALAASTSVGSSTPSAGSGAPSFGLKTGTSAK